MCACPTDSWFKAIYWGRQTAISSRCLEAGCTNKHTGIYGQACVTADEKEQASGGIQLFDVMQWQVLRVANVMKSSQWQWGMKKYEAFPLLFCTTAKDHQSAQRLTQTPTICLPRGMNACLPGPLKSKSHGSLLTPCWHCIIQPVSSLVLSIVTHLYSWMIEYWPSIMTEWRQRFELLCSPSAFSCFEGNFYIILWIKSGQHCNFL